MCCPTSDMITDFLCGTIFTTREHMKKEINNSKR